ncbi:extracellular solute-binding protein, partial [Streptomyces albogriseolus]|uniref:extracellular solute-binding protein n=1 Tax=Streptomyces albogriseolus TaxID=1887 RepID=UPI0034609FA3
MRSIRAAATGAVMLSLALAASACGGGSSTGGGSNDSPKELTYWASNQGASIEADKKVLQPELDKFEKQTGIKVKLEVVPWSDLLNRILTATTSGQGPDVLNIGNTWSASLQATGVPGIDWVEVVAENVCPGHLPASLTRLRERGVT